MARQITQRQLRNDNAKMMDELERGASFVVTRNGAPVGELRPFQRHRFVPAEVALAAFKGAARIDRRRFEADVDIP